MQLLDLYLNAKALVWWALLDKLSSTSGTMNESYTDARANNMEDILSEIVLILQYDIIQHPYQIFVLHEFLSLSTSRSFAEGTMKSLPSMLPASPIQSKQASNCFLAYLPKIRRKVKSLLIGIAGMTASALGKIQQSLHNKMYSLECIERSDINGVSTWEEVVSGVWWTFQMCSIAVMEPVEVPWPTLDPAY
jgi:hypothetical protein